MKVVECPSYPVTIFIAGDAAEARKACREHCLAVGLCVTVTPTDFIYAGGAEAGVIVGLINYPRFPADPEDIWGRALALAKILMVGLHQWSCSVQAPDKTIWLSRRPGDQAPSEAA